MDWPRTPAERIPAKRFKPPFCPWKGCPSHRLNNFRCVRDGSYSRKCDRRTIPRFHCKICTRGFGQQTFSNTYYLKKPNLLPKVAAAVVACSASRQIARMLGCSHTTVVHQANRLGRHALLLNALALEQLDALREPALLDHFETFQYCQEMAVGIATAAGARSGFVYAVDPVLHRHGGEMRPARAKRLKSLVRRHGALPTGSYRRSTERVLQKLFPKVPSGEHLRLIADGKPDYRAAALPYLESGILQLDSYPNPPRRLKHEPKSNQALLRDRAMFPVDVLHKMIRHSSANHKRETIAHGRRVNAIMLYVFIIWINFGKDRSERHPRGRSPGMDVGLVDRILDWKEILNRRLFPWSQNLSGMDRKLYSMAMETAAVGNNRRHELINAF
jgi:transposase-like protein